MCMCLHGGPLSFFFFNDTATTEIYTLSLHDALPISGCVVGGSGDGGWWCAGVWCWGGVVECDGDRCGGVGVLDGVWLWWVGAVGVVGGFWGGGVGGQCGDLSAGFGGWGLFRCVGGGECGGCRERLVGGGVGVWCGGCVEGVRYA